MLLGSLAGAGVAGADERPSQLPAVIDEVRIHATWVLWRTREDVILRELPWKAGERVTPEAWALGIARLWNDGLFSQIDARLVREGSRLVAVFDLEERLTLNPLFKFAVEGGGGSFLPEKGEPPPTYWFHLGADDTNLFGSFLEGGVTYEQFGLHPGGRLWFHNPRLFGKRLDGWFEVNYLPRPRPNFVLFRGTARAQVSYEINDELVVLGRVDGILDRFTAPPAGQGAGETILPHAAEGAQISASVRFGRVDTIRLLQKGWSLELQPLLGVTDDPTAPTFVQGWLQFLGFIPVGTRWNFAFRAQAGTVSHAPAQDLWYIGGLDLVRGLVDNAIVTNTFGVANVEVRFTAFDSTWVALVPTVFVDGVLAQGSGSAPLQKDLSVGGGIRVLIPRFVATGLRLDGAWVVGAPASQQSWYSVGVFQFF